MGSIVVSPKNPEEFQFISELLKKLGVEAKILSDQELEDSALSILMKDVDRLEIIPTEEVMSTWIQKIS